jgi:hypothetical protein
MKSTGNAKSVGLVRVDGHALELHLSVVLSVDRF